MLYLPESWYATQSVGTESRRAEEVIDELDIDVVEIIPTPPDITQEDVWTYDWRCVNQLPWCPVHRIGLNRNGGVSYAAYITESIVELVEYIPLLETLASMGVNDTLFVRIASPGGYITTAAQICSLFRRTKGRVVTEATGLCASAGSMIWADGHTCSLTNTANFMWHMSSHSDYGNTVGVAYNAERMRDYVRDVLLRVSLEKRFITQDEVDLICTDPDRSIWISSFDMQRRISKKENTQCCSTVSREEVTSSEISSVGTETFDRYTYGVERMHEMQLFKPPQIPHSLEEPVSGTTTVRSVNNDGENRIPSGVALHLFHTNNAQFRLYTTECTELDSPYFQNRFCKLLDMLTAGQSLEIFLGSNIYGSYPICSYGNMISSLERAVCKTTTIINGRAGMSETCLWLFGQNRELSVYGSLEFTGVEKYVKPYPEWIPYFKFIFNRARTLGILTKSDVSELMTTNKSIMIPYREYINIINS